MRRSGADGGQNGGGRNLLPRGVQQPTVCNGRCNVRGRKRRKRTQSARFASMFSDRTAGTIVAGVDQLGPVGRANYNLEGLAIMAGKVRHKTSGDEGLQHESNKQCVAQPHTHTP